MLRAARAALVESDEEAAWTRLPPHPNLKPYLEEAEVGDGTEGGDKEGRGLGTSVWKDPVSIPAPGTIGGVASRALLDLELDEDSLQEEIRLIKQAPNTCMIIALVPCQPVASAFMWRGIQELYKTKAEVLEAYAVAASMEASHIEQVPSLFCLPSTL